MTFQPLNLNQHGMGSIFVPEAGLSPQEEIPANGVHPMGTNQPITLEQ